jgi:hypothetical protein
MLSPGCSAPNTVGTHRHGERQKSLSDLILAGNSCICREVHMRILNIDPNLPSQLSTIDGARVSPLGCLVSCHGFDISFYLDLENLIFVSVECSDANTYCIIFRFEPAFCDSRSIPINAMLHVIFVCSLISLALACTRERTY